MKKYFVPRRLGDFDTWLENLSEQIENYGPTLGLDPAMITDLQNRIAQIRQFYADWITADSNAEAANQAFQDDKLDGMTEMILPAINHIKTLGAYTNTIGQAMKVIGNEADTDLSDKKPKISVKLAGGMPECGFVKSHSDGVRFYRKRGSETNFSFLAVDTRSPYVDNEPNEIPGTPEKREYYAFYMVDDQQVGLQSDVVEIVVG